MLEINGWFKFAELDSWENGCDPDSTRWEDGNESFTAETEDKLIAQLMEFCDVTDKQNVLINSCDQDGRIDLQRYEDEQGCVANAGEMESFKRGEINLYLACYTFNVESVTREPFAFSQGMPEFSYS